MNHEATPNSMMSGNQTPANPSNNEKIPPNSPANPPNNSRNGEIPAKPATNKAKGGMEVPGCEGEDMMPVGEAAP